MMCLSLYSYANYGTGYRFDATYLLVLAGAALCLLASGYVKSTMAQYSKIRNRANLTGAEAARRILDQNGLYNVQIECLSADSGDHYDPSSNTIRLSNSNFNNASITAVGVAAHECGHALQHAEGYAFLNFRSALVPVANLGSQLGLPMILIGVFLSWNQVLIQIGIWAFAAAVLFQIITLPVEFNASMRAVEKIDAYGLLSMEENRGAKKVLRAAAYTYVAAAASSVLQLLRLILLFGGNGSSRNSRRR